MGIGSYFLNAGLATASLHLYAALALSQSGLDGGPWPTLGHDNQRTNQSTLPGPASPGTPTVVYDAGKSIGINQVAVTSDGKILLSACVGQVIGLNSSGQPFSSAWPFQLLLTAYPGSPETPTAGITVSSNGAIYVATHECPDIPGAVPTHFYSIQPNGTETPNWPIAGNAMYWPAAIGNSGTIYQMDELQRIHAFSPSGKLLWTIGLPSYGQGDIALDSSENLYVGTDANLAGGHALYSLTSAGIARQGWPVDTGGVTAQTTPVIADDGTVYIANTSGSLYAFNAAGVLKSGFPVRAGGTVSQQPLAVSRSGVVYLKTSLGLFAFNSDGSNAWQQPFMPGGDASLSPGPVLDASGFVYVAFGNSVYSLTPGGTLRIGWPVSINAPGTLVLASNAILYVASAGQKLYAITDKPNGCDSSYVAVNSSLSNGVVSATITPTGIACHYTLTVTNNKNYWTNFVLTTQGIASIIPSGGDGDLYDKYKLLPPTQGISYTLTVSKPGDFVNIFTDPSVQTSVNAFRANGVQGILELAALGGVPLTDAPPLIIENYTAVLDAFAKMPHLQAAFSALGSNPPNILAFATNVATALFNKSEVDTLGQLIITLEVNIGKDVIEDALPKILARPWELLNVFVSNFGNIWTAVFRYPSGSVSATAY